MTPLPVRLLKSRPAWVIAIAIILGSAVVLLVAVHLRDRGGRRPRLNPDMPYTIELGRGSGWGGLDIVTIHQDGNVTLHRGSRKYIPKTVDDFVETTTLHFAPETLSAVLDAVETTELLSLDKQYHEPRIADGTQWVLWIRQGSEEKSVYCNNRFPKQIKRFAEALDSILAENGLDQAEWHRLDGDEARKNERELWESIKH